MTNDLPYFVNSPMSRLVNPFGKDEVVAQQRMETPVIYFYTDKPRTVNVRVDFPQGMLSEWYPPVEDFASGMPNIDRSTKADAAFAGAVSPVAAGKNGAASGSPTHHAELDYVATQRQLQAIREASASWWGGSKRSRPKIASAWCKA